MCLRRWRKNLFQGFRRWREKHYPVRVEGPQPWVTLCMEELRYCWSTRGKGEARPAPAVKKQGRYRWRVGPTGNTDRPLGWRAYRAQFEDMWAIPGGRATMHLAGDGLRRAAGPYHAGDPRYLRGWWEWVSGSTPFFWNDDLQKELDGMKATLKEHV